MEGRQLLLFAWGVGTSESFAGTEAACSLVGLWQAISLRFSRTTHARNLCHVKYARADVMSCVLFR